ncbi:MAG: hydrogenase nickel incorporation protein HypA [Fervidicoccaceae archaeon]
MVHEWALAESIATYLSEKHGGRAFNKIVIGVGILQSIDLDILDFALRELLNQYNVKVAKIEYRTIEVELKCRACGYSWKLLPEELGAEASEMIHFIPEAIHSFIKCPRCGSRDYEVLKGRGIYIEEISYDEE